MSAEYKRVLYISHAEVGGAALSLIGMLDCLKNYITPIVIIPRKGDFEKLLIQYNIKYLIVPFTYAYAKIGNYTQMDSDRVYIDNVCAAYKIARIVEEQHIQMIHSNSSIIDVGAIAAVIANVPHLWHLREFCEEDFGMEFINQEWKKLLFDTSNFFSISQSIKNSYYKKYLLKSDMAINFVDARLITQNHLIFTNKIVTIIIAGEISPGKGQLDAIRAINILVKKNIFKIRLIVVGNGTQNYVWILKKYIEYNNLNDYIKICQFHSDLDEIRKNCDISLTCSKMEGLGRVTLEAMIAGIVVIGADTGGTKELIGDNQERGYLYVQGDFRDLASKLELAIEDKLQRNIKRENALNYTREITNSKLYAEKILSTYEQCVSIFCEKSSFREKVMTYMDTNTVKGDGSIEIMGNDMTIAMGNKFQEMFILAEKWLRIHNEGKTIGNYMRTYGYQTIAIYGIGYLGQRVYDELLREGIGITYIVDKIFDDVIDMDDWIPLLNPNNNLPQVDLIIITTVMEADDIKAMLTARYLYSIVNLSDIIDGMLMEH